tara:strand:+ start:2075 stop:2485 length:411 start_codon:yes stop_codon:yes gene_type:complete
MAEILHQLDTMSRIIDCIKLVKSEMGNYHRENIYQTSLCVELNINRFIIQSEVIIPIFYKNVYVGLEKADIIIYNSKGEIDYILELKSQAPKISSKEINQLRKYLIDTKCQNGILVNFYDKLHIIKVTTDCFEIVC